jgi:2'-5' RNA ligase
MRLFAGIPLAPAVIEELSAISVRLRSNDDGLRWSAPESWHITLQFLGNTGQEQYDCTVARLGQLRSRALTIRLEELGLFERAGVFFEGKGRLRGLHELKARIHRQPAFSGFVAQEFVLYESVTKPTGALYEVRERFRLD